MINRTDLDAHLKEAIGQKTADWGVSVDSVELRDVKVPVALQDAMSREAQAEREKRARVLLGTAELAIAQSFVDAATTYGDNKTALALRAMNITYEVAKAGSVVIMPSGSIGSTDIAQIAALTTSIGHNDTGPRQ